MAAWLSKRRDWSLGELALALALPATVFAFTMGSSSVPIAITVGSHLRWVMLYVLLGVAVVFGMPKRACIPQALLGLTGALGVIGILSATWSVRPRLSAERAISFVTLIAAAALIAAGLARSAKRQRLVMYSLLAGPAAVAIAGLVLLAVDSRLALQQPTSAGYRLQGLGEDPNTASMLFALALPVAVWLGISARRWRARVVAAALAALLYGSVIASGSRGAFLAAVAGTVVLLVVRVRPFRILVVAVVVAIALLGGTDKVFSSRAFLGGASVETGGLAPRGQASSSATTPGGKKQTSSPTRTAPVVSSTLPAPTHPTGRFTVPLLPAAPKSTPASQPVYTQPFPFPPEKDEIGNPAVYQYKPILVYGSGRVYAWLSAIQTGRLRPLLGYGFGTEEYVFVDRSYYFEGGFAENAFVGIFLQLGLAGVLLLAAPFVLLAVALVRVLRRVRAPDRSMLAVGGAVASGGFVVAFFQSYLYSVGNVATLTVWIATFAVLAMSAAALRGEVTE